LLLLLISDEWPSPVRLWSERLKDIDVIKINAKQSGVLGGHGKEMREMELNLCG